MVILMYFNGKFLVFYLDFQRSLCIFAKKIKRRIIKILRNYGNSRKEWNY